jgi:hypothetical protein
MKKLIKKLNKIPEISGKFIFLFFSKYLLTIIYSKFYYSIVNAILTIE